MRKFLLPTFAALLASALPSFALSGGPFQNDSSLETGADGTYQASFRGNNLIGVVVFGWSAISGGSGRFAIFDRGIGRSGDLSPVVDFPSRNIAAVFGSDNFTGQNDSTGAFDARITRTSPILTFSGSGQSSNPSDAITASNTVDTVSVTVQQAPITSGGVTTQSTINTVTTDTTDVLTTVTVPFKILGFRSSTFVTNFATGFLAGLNNAAPAAAN